MIEMKTIAPVQQQDSLLLTMADLRRKRIELKMSAYVAAQYLGVSQPTLSNYERGDHRCPMHIFELYREYLEGCANETIYYRKSRYDNLGSPAAKKYLDEMCISIDMARNTRNIRKALHIKVQQILSLGILSMSGSSLRKKEVGEHPMLKTEYNALMRFYRQEKLKRTFGSHYREGMMSCQKQVAK